MLHPARLQDTVGALGTDARHTQQRRPVRRVYLHGKKRRMPQRPGAFRVKVRVKVRLFLRQQLPRRKMIIPQQPVRLIQPMLPQKGRLGLQGRQAAVLDHRQIRRVKHTLQRIFLVQRLGQIHNMAVIFRRCTDNHLRALPSRGKRRGVAVHRKFSLALRILHGDLLHRAQNGGFLFVGGKLVQADLARQFNIDRKPIRQKPQLLHQNGVGARYRLGVDIPVKAVFLAQNPQRPDHQFHRPVGGLDHRAGQKQPLDIIAFVEPDR